MNIPRLLGVLFEIKAEGTTVHLDVRRYPPPTGLWIQNFTCHVVHRVIAQRDDRRPRGWYGGRLSFDDAMFVSARTRTASYYFLPVSASGVCAPRRDLITDLHEN